MNALGLDAVGYPGHLTLRAAKPEDFDFLYGLHRAVFQDYVAQVWGWNEAWQEEHYRQQFNPSANQIISLEGRDAGVIRVSETESEVFLSNIEVLPEFQGSGLGTSLIRALLAHARRFNKPVLLQVLKVNPAQRLYLRLGFSIVGESETHYLMKASPEGV